jgi:hypothetical protein
MNDHVLPKLESSAAPEFVDGASAKEWVEHLPLANVSASQGELFSQLSEFNRYPSKAADRLAALEALREALHFVQIEQAKRFSNRALPMTDSESAIFGETTELWEQMHLGYLRCIEAAAAGESGVRSQAALVCQRALAYSGLKMFHYHRAYRQVPAGEWRSLHGVYARAEQLGVAEQRVVDYLSRDVNETSPRIAYVRVLLMGLCNPNELSQRQLTFVANLLERWGDKIEVVTRPVVDGDLPPLVVDLAGEACAERTESAVAEPRYLDTRRLAKSLRNRIGLLRKGESPARLALGEDCVQPSCEQLLVLLYRNWCQGKPLRAAERRSISEAAQVCNGMVAIHFHLSGRAFHQPGERKELTQKQRNEIETFGRLSTRDEEEYGRAQGLEIEDWQLQDESAQGLRMRRRGGAPGKRYSHGQLVAVRPGDSKNFMLAQVRWLMSAANNDLHAGLKLLPGLPAATAARATGLNVTQAEYVRALSLTAVPALDSPPTLVLPTAWYKPNRVIEVYVAAPVRVRLTTLVERGSDFERVAYEILQ